MEVFQNYAYYYNAFYGDKDYRAETQIVDNLLKKYAENVKSIINFGCGTGRHDIELSKLGRYKCKGIDLSPSMIEIAKENCQKEKLEIEFEVADIKNYETVDKYDAVISLFHVMSYQNSNEDILSAFQSARKALEVGGIFLFDIWYGPGVLSDKPCTRIKEVEDERNRLIRIAKPVMHDKKNVVDVNYEILVVEKKTGQMKSINEVHNMRYFFRPELELLLSLADFELVDNIDCQTLDDTDYNSWTSYFIVKAI